MVELSCACQPSADAREHAHHADAAGRKPYTIGVFLRLNNCACSIFTDAVNHLQAEVGEHRQCNQAHAGHRLYQ